MNVDTLPADAEIRAQLMRLLKDQRTRSTAGLAAKHWLRTRDDSSLGEALDLIEAHLQEKLRPPPESLPEEAPQEDPRETSAAWAEARALLRDGVPPEVLRPVSQIIKNGEYDRAFHQMMVLREELKEIRKGSPSVTMHWRGIWDQNVNYKPGDVVSLDGDIFITITESEERERPRLGNRSSWVLIASRSNGGGGGGLGSVGPSGPTGATGPAGPAGPAGAAGGGASDHDVLENVTANQHHADVHSDTKHSDGPNAKPSDLHAQDHDHDGSPTQKLAQANTHETPDTDAAAGSLHHTIGGGASQAAAGNHAHAGEPSYAAQVLADAPVGFWKLDETSGTNADDSSGNNRDGTINGSPALNQGGPFAGAGALGFDGSNDYVSIPSDAGLNITGDLTISGWFYVATFGTLGPWVTKCVGNQGVYELRPVSSIKTGLLNNAGAGPTSDYVWPVNEWHHFAVVKRRVGVLFFVDGEWAGRGSDTPDPTTNTAAVLLGTRADNFAFFQGRMYGICIFNKALKQARIQAHALATAF